jgi:ribonuclease HI
MNSNRPKISIIKEKSKLLSCGVCISNTSNDIRDAGYAIILPYHQERNEACKIIGDEKQSTNRSELLAFCKAYEAANALDPSGRRKVKICTGAEVVIKTHKYMET